MDDDLLVQFASLTGVEVSEAPQWLDMCGGQLSEAIDLYFSTVGTDRGSINSGGTNSVASSMPPTSEVMNGISGAKRSAPVNFNDTACVPPSIAEGIECNIPPRPPQSFIADGLAIADGEWVRRPDEVKRQRLISAGSSGSYFVKEDCKKALSAFASGSNFIPRNEKERTLACLFKPPMSIMTLGDFEFVKDTAKSQNKWMLVNIQEDSEFQCHLLNRDFWAEESVQDMVLCSFIFWQMLSKTPDGQQFCSRYKVQAYPFIGIIDPRTGALQWSHTGNFTKDKLAEKLQDFLGERPEPSLSKRFTSTKHGDAVQDQASQGGHDASRCSGAVASISSINTGGDTAVSSALRKDVDVLDFAVDSDAEEDVMMLRAIQESLRQFKSTAKSSDELHNTGEGAEERCAHDVTVAAATAAATSESSAAPSMLIHERLGGFLLNNIVNYSDETKADSKVDGDSSIKTVFRLPGNQKSKAEFKFSDAAISVAVHAAQQLSTQLPQEAGRNYRFEVYFNYPRQALSEVPGLLSGCKMEEAGITVDTAFHVVQLME